MSDIVLVLGRGLYILCLKALDIIDKKKKQLKLGSVTNKIALWNCLLFMLALAEGLHKKTSQKVLLHKNLFDC